MSTPIPTKNSKPETSKTTALNGANGSHAPLSSFTALPTDEVPELTGAKLEAEMRALDKERQAEERLAQAERLEEAIEHNVKSAAPRRSTPAQQAARALRPHFWSYLAAALALASLGGYFAYQGRELYAALGGGAALVLLAHLYLGGRYTHDRLVAVGAWAGALGGSALVGVLAAVPLTEPVYALARHYRYVGFWTYHWTNLALWFDHYTDSLRFWYAATAVAVALATFVLAVCTGRTK